jgi:hypothetical protein
MHAPSDGLFLILLPIAGVVGAVAGWKAMQRVDSGAALATLRGVGIAALIAALVAAFPIAVVIYDVNRANGLVRIEWGFWASALSALAMGLGALGLIRAKDGGASDIEREPYRMFIGHDLRTGTGCSAENPNNAQFCRHR